MGSYVLLPPAHRHVDPLHPEILEQKLASQKEEIEQLVEDNHQLASTHVALRHDLAAAQEEIERLKEHIRSIRAESDIQIRIISEKMAKKEGDIQASNRFRKDLQQAISEAQKIATTNRELSAKLVHATEELEKARSELKNLPQMQTELDKLQKEYLKLRKTFDYEKGLNVTQVENMKLMELDLVGKASELERLQAELLNAERKVQVNNSFVHPYTHQMSHPMPSNMAYPDGYGMPPHATQLGIHHPLGEGIIPYGAAPIGPGVGSANFAWGQQRPY
ncbi:unnamed protein product [Cuscuta epithymum]|uniref:Uncharacterized protein n=1 Tax=Cuscuta epithymum TaxID=186058 RepID=A0AAV0G4Z4_9ASTE|nr:unnamed protein product [Cuscuta epithymum]